MLDESPPPEPTGAMNTSALFSTLEDLTAIASPGTGTILYNRRFDSGSELSENLRAVAIARTLRRTSVDTVRREYAHHPLGEQTQPAREKYVHAYRIAQRHVETSLGNLKTNPATRLTLGMYAGSIALHRLKFSLFAAHLLYQLRLRFEADSVARHVLEQIAWAVAVAHLDDSDQIARVQPQKSIGRLTALSPEAGPLYGTLSSTTHAGIDRHLAVFQTNKDERGIISHGLTDWTGSAHIILTLADLWVVAHEHTQREHMQAVVSTDPTNGYRPNADRAFLPELRTAVHEIASIEKNAPASD